MWKNEIHTTQTQQCVHATCLSVASAKHTEFYNLHMKCEHTGLWPVAAMRGKQDGDGCKGVMRRGIVGVRMSHTQREK